MFLAEIGSLSINHFYFRKEFAVILTKGPHQVEVSALGATVTRWQYGSNHILFPQQRVMVGDKQKLRGGVPICLPVHGMPPKKWQNRGLEQHGFLRGMIPNHTYLSSDAQTGWMVFHHRSAPLYPWDFTCEVRVGFTDKEELFHSVTVRRERDGSPAGMPLIVGLHHYFATPNGTFTIGVKDKSLCPDDVPLGESAFYSIGAWATLTTLFGTIKMHLGGFTGVVVWRDSDHYVCVEPVTPRSFGGKRGTHLVVNGVSAFGCILSFTPNGK